MWTSFYAAGGWGMYPVTLLGFLLLAASVLYALRPQKKLGRLALILGGMTLLAGVLGALVGICNSFHYIPQVAPAEQLPILALGVEESLHDVVLALLLALAAGMGLAVGAARAPSSETRPALAE